MILVFLVYLEPVALQAALLLVYKGHQDRLDLLGPWVPQVSHTLKMTLGWPDEHIHV